MQLIPWLNSYSHIYTVELHTVYTPETPTLTQDYWFYVSNTNRGKQLDTIENAPTVYVED